MSAISTNYFTHTPENRSESTSSPNQFPKTWYQTLVRERLNTGRHLPSARLKDKLLPNAQLLKAASQAWRDILSLRFNKGEPADQFRELIQELQKAQAKETAYFKELTLFPPAFITWHLQKERNPKLRAFVFAIPILTDLFLESLVKNPNDPKTVRHFVTINLLAKEYKTIAAWFKAKKILDNDLPESLEPQLLATRDAFLAKQPEEVRKVLSERMEKLCGFHSS